MGERIGRIGQIETDFFDFLLKIREKQKKSVSICPIRPIRSSIASQPNNILPFLLMLSQSKGLRQH
jgi:hypothetical protein